MEKFYRLVDFKIIIITDNNKADMTIKEQLEKNSKSKKNEQELLKLLSKSNYSGVRFLIAPDKNVSDEAVLESTLSIFKRIEEYKQSGTPNIVFSSKK
jgi:hypothetical protein